MREEITKIQVNTNVFGLTRKDIENVLAPLIMKRYAFSDPEWLSILSRLRSRRGWIMRFLKAYAYRKLFGSTKRVDRVRRDYTQAWIIDTYYPGSKVMNESSQIIRWGDTGLEIKGLGEKRVHLLLMKQVVEHLKPRRILEVGSGNGAMLMMLSVMCPDAEYHGVELTEAGVNSARKLQELSSLPEDMVEFLPAPARDLSAFRNVKFQVGNATQLPYLDQSFDLVLTSLALEQMKAVQNEVLAQIVRVAAGEVLMLEPFPDFNCEPEQRHYTRTREYFSVPVAALCEHGLQPTMVFGDIPSKILRGVGLVIAKPIRT